MALVRLTPMAAITFEYLHDDLESTYTEPPVDNPDHAIEAYSVEYGTIYQQWNTPLGAERYRWLTDSRDRIQRRTIYESGRMEESDTGERRTLTSGDDDWGDAPRVAVIYSRRRQYTYHESRPSGAELDNVWDRIGRHDLLLGFRVPAGPVRRAVLRFRYHRRPYDPDTVLAIPTPEGELVVGVGTPPLPFQEASLERLAARVEQQVRPLWRRRHDRIPWTPQEGRDPDYWWEHWWEPTRELVAQLPAYAIRSPVAWLQLAVAVDGPVPDAVRPPDATFGSYPVYREGHLELDVPVQQCVLEVEIGEPEPRRTVVHVAKLESARRRASSTTAVTRPR